ncbi:hypothetical protein YYC_01327 [Plasmodium yoelii 17X]|uniref:Phospholipid/glycerol acyltransferase domain-containing protein n=1 Tax=Plasmodium yoelii 17X TaxID=1323249 RepID=V7PR24_PLAYE|nr:hypothetical protein YYC_01327 [Plasmodium yoelii 17X]
MGYLHKSISFLLFFMIFKITIVENIKNKSLLYVKTYYFSEYQNNKHLFPFRQKNNNNNKYPSYLTDKNNQIFNNVSLNKKTYDEAYEIICNELELLKKENSDNISHIQTFLGFVEKYYHEIKKHNSCSPETFLKLFLKYIETFKKYRYYSFPNVNKYDESLYEWSLEFWLPLIDQKNSRFLGTDNIKKINNWIEQGHNVFIFSNHHIEADANIIKYYFHINNAENISRNMVFIGGHKIRVDPLSRPFTVSANILCIYSKKYIEYPPHLKEEKILFNHKSLNALKNMLNLGKNIIWVAPSGGRDRKSQDNEIQISPFDPKIIKTFNIFAKRSNIKTHFVGMALNTYNICPPPNTIDVDEIEKERSCSYSPIGLNLGDDIFDIYPQMGENEITDKIYNYVNDLYKKI